MRSRISVVRVCRLGPIDLPLANGRQPFGGRQQVAWLNELRHGEICRATEDFAGSAHLDYASIGDHRRPIGH